MQFQEWRNAENLSESVGVSARALQRFLTDSRWDDDAVIERLQEYLAPRLGHPYAVWVLDGSDFPKQGRKSAGVARQYCGRLGKVSNCQVGGGSLYVLSSSGWTHSAISKCDNPEPGANCEGADSAFATLQLEGESVR